MPDTFRLGQDLVVRRLGFGAMRLPTAGWFGPARDPETGRAVLRRAIARGVNHIDTAAFYQSGDGSVRANDLIREALAPYPGLVIATKVGPTLGPDGLAPGGPEDLRPAVEENLAMLGLDRLDLVYLRIGHMGVPHGESLGKRFEVLARLRDEGLIRHLGVSNIDTGQLAEARSIAPVVAVQNHFHPGHQDDRALLDTCAAAGIAFVPYFPLGGGRGDPPARLAEVAARHEASPAQVALAWLLALAPVTLAIPGTGSLAHLDENLDADALTLTAQDLADLGDG